MLAISRLLSQIFKIKQKNFCTQTRKSVIEYIYANIYIGFLTNNYNPGGVKNGDDHSVHGLLANSGTQLSVSVQPARQQQEENTIFRLLLVHNVGILPHRVLVRAALTNSDYDC